MPWMRGGDGRRRLTVRARLTLSHAALLALASAGVLTVLGIFLLTVPNYEFAATTTVVDGTRPSAAVVESLAPVHTSVDDGGSTLLDVSSRNDLVRVLLWSSAGALVVIVAVGTWMSWLSAGRLTRPLRQMNAAAVRAAHGDLSHRIAVSGPRDELVELAETFNEMLGRLEDQLRAHQRFAADASHELRTPLATTKAMLEVAIAESTRPDRPLLEALRRTNDRSIATVGALMDLSEAAHAEGSGERVDLHDIASAVRDECREEAAQRRVTVEVRGQSAVVLGDAVLLHHLVLNLFHNAIRHNVEGGSADVLVGHDADGAATLRVANGGDRIDPTHLPRLTAPFYRAAGRTAPAAARGRGLGLALVDAIVRRHHGRLELTAPADGGLVVFVSLPYDCQPTGSVRTS